MIMTRGPRAKIKALHLHVRWLRCVLTLSPPPRPPSGGCMKPGKCPAGNKEVISMYRSEACFLGNRVLMMRSPFVTSYAACSLCTSLRREINREHVGVRRRRRRRSDDRRGDIVLGLFTLLCITYWAPLSSAFHWSSCASLLRSRRRRDVSGPVRLTHLPISQVCARCRPPADTAPARHRAHSCRSLRRHNIQDKVFRELFRSSRTQMNVKTRC